MWNAGKTVTFLIDPEGTKYILHASPDKLTADAGLVNPHVTATYPDGWYLKTEILNEDLHLLPDRYNTPSKIYPKSTAQPGMRAKFESISCGYAIVQDSAGNSFHRLTNEKGAPRDLKPLFWVRSLHLKKYYLAFQN